MHYCFIGNANYIIEKRKSVKLLDRCTLNVQSRLGLTLGTNYYGLKMPSSAGRVAQGNKKCRVHIQRPHMTTHSYDTSVRN